jgi:hypothetical protein
MTRIATLLALVPLLASCALWPSGDTAVRDAWLGAPYDEVVARWGAPVRSAALSDGRFVYTWRTDGVVSRSSVWPSIAIAAGSGFGVGIGVGVGAGASREVPVSCERILTFTDRRVVEQTWHGPTDYCSEFRRQ